MNNKYKVIICILTMFVMLSTTIYGELLSGVQTNIINVSVCYGNIDISVQPNKGVIYQLIDCSVDNEDTNKWHCPCVINNETKIDILVQENETAKFSIIYQYYIGQTKPVNITYNNGLPTEDEVYNEQLKRIGNVETDTFYNSIELQRIKKEQQIKTQGMQSFILTFFMYGFGGLFALIVFIMIIIFIKNRIRRWLKLKDYEKLTIGKILKKIFSREDINRFELGKQDVVKLNNTKKTIPIKSIPLSTEDEARKILEDIDK